MEVIEKVASTKVMEFYKEWVHGDISLSDNKEAELVKLLKLL